MGIRRFVVEDSYTEAEYPNYHYMVTCDHCGRTAGQYEEGIPWFFDTMDEVLMMMTLYSWVINETTNLCRCDQCIESASAEARGVGHTLIADNTPVRFRASYLPLTEL